MSVFYKPADSWAGDFIPFYWQGEYHLFYLKDYRDKEKQGEGTPWFHISTCDFVNFTDYGEALSRGGIADQDLYVFTGCVIHKDESFHIFYTGHNPHFRQQNKPVQAVMHATSSDLITWEKDPANPILFADFQRYEMHDWRDPFVFWNEAAQEYWMLLAARTRTGPGNRRGITALAVSEDLTQWEVCEPFWEPHLYFTHECPDLFQWGDWWYQIYSTFSERHITHYRKCKDLLGPWIAPANDSFDGRAFYAAKTAGDGQRRFAFGWNPTRSADSDSGRWNWGGSLVVHEITQALDGSLNTRLPDEIRSCFQNPLPLKFEPQIGEWIKRGERFCSHEEDGFAWCRFSELSGSCLITTEVNFTEQTRGCGLLIKADEKLDTYYKIQLEPGRDRIVFDRWPRPGDEPVIMERPVELQPSRPVELQVIVEDTIVVIYVDDQVAMSVRAYESTGEFVGLFSTEGYAEFSNTAVWQSSH